MPKNMAMAGWKMNRKRPGPLSRLGSLPETDVRRDRSHHADTHTVTKKGSLRPGPRRPERKPRFGLSGSVSRNELSPSESHPARPFHDVENLAGRPGESEGAPDCH
jgi:hypothetical protein